MRVVFIECSAGDDSKNKQQRDGIDREPTTVPAKRAVDVPARVL